MFETPEDEQADIARGEWFTRELHGELLANRFSALVLKGYRPMVPCEMDSFDFEHPNKKAIQVQLWADGQLVDRYPTMIEDGKRTIIAPEDQERFKRFLAHVPKPTELQTLGATPLGEVLTTVVVWVLCLGIGSLVWAIIKWAWRLVNGHG